MCGQEKSGADPQGDALFTALLENLSVPVYPLPSLPQGLSAFDGADEGLSANNKFNISGLSTTGYSSPVFTFGLACATAGFDPAQLEVYVNSADAADDGTPLSYTYESNGEWMLCTVSTGIPSGENLRIRIVSQASFRLDDFKLTGEK